MNYAEQCRKRANRMRELHWQIDTARLLDAAAVLYEGCSSVHFRDAQDAVALADAAAKGAE